MPHEITFVNWESATDVVACGRLADRLVILSGVLAGGSVVDGGFPSFQGPAFTPPLHNTDTVNIVAVDGHEFTLALSAPIEDVHMHFQSLASIITFRNGTPLERLSGDERFVVAADSVSGSPQGTSDANGSVRFSGPVTVLRFAARPNFVGGSLVDGVYLQLGGRIPAGD